VRSKELSRVDNGEGARRQTSVHTRTALLEDPLLHTYILLAPLAVNIIPLTILPVGEERLKHVEISTIPFKSVSTIPVE
jgi:hypothetical protein